ncbi:DivIVA domain-containing protein [Enterococcus hulanensis]|uniref:DivIVA domain-containing protein n=1 Tax=Enterococcus hulanensis TaxID=2559929 RepID=UPI00288D98FA|nr:DivIVA domain-containing protein [Enterococcus hulanensis]MDT2662976.1 DivIVA domain-containing protein [Enterococcus hulanensis]
MYFKPVDIRRMTFRRGLFGFRKADVKDFLRHVQEDYDQFIEKDKQITEIQQELANKQQTITDLNEKIAQLTLRIGQLSSENTSLRELENDYQDIEKMQLMAQRTVNTVQEEADKLLARAKQENERSLKQAEAQKMNQLMNIQIEVEGLIKEQRSLTIQVADKKTELLDLEIQCEEIMAQKQDLVEKTHLLRENFLSMQEGISNHGESFNEGNQAAAEDQAGKRLGLKAKRIG